MPRTARLKLSTFSYQPAERQRGFTIIELLVVMGMSAVLLAIAVVAIARPQQRNSVETVTNVLVSDLKQQQLLSMEGDSGSQTTAQAHGIRITASGYTSFTGSAFTGSSNNYTVNFPQGITASFTPLPLDIIFNKHSGETAPVSNLVIQDSTNDKRTFTINRLGGISVN